MDFPYLKLIQKIVILIRNLNLILILSCDTIWQNLIYFEGEAHACLQVPEASLKVEVRLGCTKEQVGLLTKIVQVIKQEPFSASFRHLTFLLIKWTSLNLSWFFFSHFWLIEDSGWQERLRVFCAGAPHTPTSCFWSSVALSRTLCRMCSPSTSPGPKKCCRVALTCSASSSNSTTLASTF